MDQELSKTSANFEESEDEFKSKETVSKDNTNDELGEEEEDLISTTSEPKTKVFRYPEADTSGESIRTDDLEEEIKDMYEIGEGIEEELEEGEEEEEQEDLSEFRMQLEERYMNGVKVNAEYVDRMNKNIAEVQQQIYAFEVYVDCVRTYHGYSGHWLRLKIFDSPCFEIHPCKQVELMPSLYGIRSAEESKGTNGFPIAEEVDEEEIEEEENIPDSEDYMALPVNLTGPSEEEGEEEDALTPISPRRNSDRPAKTINFDSEVAIKEVTHGSDTKVTNEDDFRPHETLVFKEPFQNGKTIMFPMMPKELIHMIQRRPLVVNMMSSTKSKSSATIDLTCLIEVVIRASKGPPYPISSSFRFNIDTKGDYVSNVSGTIKLIAFGTQDVCTIKCVVNPNEIKSLSYRREKPILTEWNMDCQNKTAMLTGPQKYTLHDIAKIIRNRKPAEFKLPPKPKQKRYFVEDLIFDRKANSVSRAPKKTFDILRAEIDKYLVLNKSSKEHDKSEQRQSEDICDEIEDYDSSLLSESIEEELLEEFEESEEEDEVFEELVTPTERAEAVLRSLQLTNR